MASRQDLPEQGNRVILTVPLFLAYLLFVECARYHGRQSVQRLRRPLTHAREGCPDPGILWQKSRVQKEVLRRKVLCEEPIHLHHFRNN